MSKGFVVVAQNTSTEDYVTQAYALALSIKYSQKESAISIITNDKIPENYKLVFDQIIPIPWGDAAIDSEWKVENRWKIFHVTPYNETIVLDTDMLLLEDISKWWEYCSTYDLKFCSRIKNHKLESITDTVHRKAFIANNLPPVYFALHYFKKSEQAREFYKILEFICNNWEGVYGIFAPNEYQNWLSMDLSAAIAIDLMGLNETAIDTLSPMEFIHMKPAIQDWPAIPERWQDLVHGVLNKKGELIVGNIKQSKLFHYVDPSFITPELLMRLEELVHEKEKE